MRPPTPGWESQSGRARAVAAAGANVPLALPGPCEVVICNPALPPPAHRRAGAALPQPRGSPLGGNWRQLRKSLEPEAGQRGCEGLPAALGGARLAAKNRQAAAAVCAKFWVARKGAARAAAQSRASCGRSRRATSGDPMQIRGDWEKCLLLPRRQPRLG